MSQKEYQEFSVSIFYKIPWKVKDINVQILIKLNHFSQLTCNVGKIFQERGSPRMRIIRYDGRPPQQLWMIRPFHMMLQAA